MTDLCSSVFISYGLERDPTPLNHTTWQTFEQNSLSVSLEGVLEMVVDQSTNHI